MTPAELEALIGAGDKDAVLVAMRDLAESERRALAPTALRLEKRAWSQYVDPTKISPAGVNFVDMHNAASAAVVCSAVPSEMADRSLRPLWDTNIAFAALAARKPPWLPGYAESIVAKDISRWPLAHALVVAGHCERPTCDNWCLGFLPHRGAKVLAWGVSVSSPAAHLDDAAFMSDEFWRLFEIEGTSEVSWALIDRFMFDQKLTWGAAILERADRIGRARLLDATLSALTRDFVQFRAGWFIALHRDLAPTTDERTARADAYLALLASRNPPTVAFALDALIAIDKAGALPAGALAAHVGPALQSRVKKCATAALRLIERAAAREAQSSGSLAAAATDALAHEAVEVQTRALAIVTKLGDRRDAVLCERVRDRVSTVAATLRPRLIEWLGDTGEPAVEHGAGTKVDASPRTTKPAPDRPLARATSLDEAIDLLAGAIERYESPDEIEGALAGVARFCGERPADFADRIGPLAKRAAKLLAQGNRTFVISDLFGALCQLALAWSGSGEAPPANDVRGMRALLNNRVREVALRAAAARPATLLATPTHKDGWIDAEVLVGRALGTAPDEWDAVQSLLRIAPHGRPAALAKAAGVEGELGAALRFALGGEREGPVKESDLWSAAEAARVGDNLWPRFDLLTDPMALGADFDDRSFTKSQMLALRWVATVFPADMQGYFRAGGSAIIAGLKGRHALWWNPVYLEPLLRPDVPMSNSARRLLAAGLASGQAAEAGLATDALIQIVDDGRGDAAELGDTFAMLLAAEVEPIVALSRSPRAIEALRANKLIGAPISCARWAKRLQDAARASARHAAFVRDVIVRGLRGLPSPPPGDLAALLVLLRELCAETGAAIADDDARAKLAAIAGSGKAARAARALLEIEPAPDQKR